MLNNTRILRLIENNHRDFLQFKQRVDQALTQIFPVSDEEYLEDVELTPEQQLASTLANQFRADLERAMLEGSLEESREILKNMQIQRNQLRSKFRETGAFPEEDPDTLPGLQDTRDLNNPNWVQPPQE